MEEYLLSQLDTPVVLKDGTMMTKPDGSPMTKQGRKPKGKRKRPRIERIIAVGSADVGVKCKKW